jgi:tRNA nucleotidyltransferase (CCA-adding enzyme)
MSSSKPISLRLPESLRTQIAPARRLARREGTRLFLVCGAVRDALLGRPVVDVDLAVEGDAIAFARGLAKSTGGRLTAHERFGTARLELPDGTHLDFARTRRETYETPAALPLVSPATIHEDLARRDFTINALALEIAPGTRTRLLDPFGGRRDLARGAIRMLHPRSPIDDPTRAFRAVRFATRFGFTIEPRTASWIRQAVAAGVFDRLSGERLRREIERIFSEERPADAMRTMAALGLPGAVSPALSGSAPVRARLSRVARLARSRPGRATWLAFLLAWAADLDARSAEALAARLALDRESHAVLSSWPAALAATPEDPAVARMSFDSLLAAAASAPDAATRRRFERVLDAPRVSLSIGGRDLVREGVSPGPAIGRALARTLEARRAGQIAAEHELSYALSVARQLP